MIPIEFVGGIPAWGVRVVRPRRFLDVPYKVRPKLFRLRQGALLAVLLKLYDVPDQPYFIHRVMDLTDPSILRYVEACGRAGRLVAVFETVGEEEGFRRELELDGPLWERLLQEGRDHNGQVQADGEAALKAFMEIFTPVSGVKGVQPAWDEVDRVSGMGL